MSEGFKNPSSGSFRHLISFKLCTNLDSLDSSGYFGDLFVLITLKALNDIFNAKKSSAGPGGHKDVD